MTNSDSLTTIMPSKGSDIPQFVENTTPSNKNFGTELELTEFASRVDGSILKLIGYAFLPISGTIPCPLTEQ